MISCAVLCRDDEKTLEACLQSVRPHVDELCVLDTGSIDSSPQIAKRYADKFAVYLGANDEATELISDFADARNQSMAMCSGDVFAWIDADDLLVGGEHLRSIAEKMGPEALTLVAYEYQHDAQGRPTCVHWRESLVKPRDKWRWSIPVHEVLLPQGIPSPVAETTHLVRRIHRKQLSVKAPDPERNLRILKKYVARVGEGDVRAWYYLGVEYSIRGDHSNALRILERYVELAGWTDEKCLALLEIARIYQRLGLYAKAVEWAQRAQITKSWPEPYWTIAECFYSLAASGIDEEYNSKRAMHAAELGLSMPAAETVLFVNPMKRFETYGILHQLYARAGQIERALDACRKGLEGMPEDQMMSIRALQYEDLLTKNSLVSTAQKAAGIRDKLASIGAHDAAQWCQVQALVSSALGIVQPSHLQAAAPEVPEQLKADGCLDLVFFLGPGYEPWSPATLMAGGMGGSETMAWELAKRLRAMGHRVRMFAHAQPDQEGVYDGVEYLNYERFPGVTCDVLIASRRPDVGHVCSALARILWVHDVHVGDALTPARALSFDRILALSNWHKEHLLQVYSAGAPLLIAALRPEDVTVTRNGIDLARFDAEQSVEALPMLYHDGGHVGAVQLKPEFGGATIPRWAIKGTGLVVGGAVFGAEDWETLTHIGVSHCISITDPPDIGIPSDRLLSVPIPDEGQPMPPELLATATDFARKALNGGGRLYVHCWMGHSRSPSLAYAIMRKLYGLPADVAESAIRESSPFGDFGQHPKHRSYIASVEQWIAATAASRNPKRIIYSSSPDRGLQTLLEMWPEILKHEPEAELHVFYGFDGWERHVAMTGAGVGGLPQTSPTALRQIKHMLRSLPRVTMHGRINGADLANEMLQSGVLAYPTWFSETSCITAMEAQAAGLYVVTTPVAALVETVGANGCLVPGQWDQPQGPSETDREAFVMAVVDALRGTVSREEIADVARKRFGLDELARDWDKMLRETLADAQERVVPAWRAA